MEANGAVKGALLLPVYAIALIVIFGVAICIGIIIFICCCCECCRAILPGRRAK